jgi:hypothetical protein
MVGSLRLASQRIVEKLAARPHIALPIHRLARAEQASRGHNDRYNPPARMPWRPELGINRSIRILRHNSSPVSAIETVAPFSETNDRKSLSARCSSAWRILRRSVGIADRNSGVFNMRLRLHLGIGRAIWSRHAGHPHFRSLGIGIRWLDCSAVACSGMLSRAMGVDYERQTSSVREKRRTGAGSNEMRAAGSIGRRRR